MAQAKSIFTVVTCYGNSVGERTLQTAAAPILFVFVEG